MDAPDPFGANGASSSAPRPAVPVASPATGDSAPLAPPAFRRPRPAARGRRTVVLILSSVIVLALLGVVGVIASRLLFSGGEATATPTPAETQPTEDPAASALPPAVSPGASNPPADAGAEVGDGDGDGLTNAEENFYRTDNTKADTDGDGFTDSQEVRGGYDPLGPGKLDSDNDGFPDPDEREFGSDPFNPDTDGDGYSDGQEIKNGYNPLIPSPGDKL